MSTTKKYFWLKLKTDFFSDVRIKKMRKIAGGDTYVIILQKIMLLSLENNGIFEHESVEENLAAELSLLIDEQEINIQVTLDFMAKHKMKISDLAKTSDCNRYRH